MNIIVLEVAGYEAFLYLMHWIAAAFQCFHHRGLFWTKQVTVSSDAMQESVRMSEADVEISRHRFSVFLSQHTAYELLPESGKVWIPLLL